jgi:hypothetical protein
MKAKLITTFLFAVLLAGAFNSVLFAQKKIVKKQHVTPPPHRTIKPIKARTRAPLPPSPPPPPLPPQP